MQLKLFNTETREKESIQGHALKMYTCGPTIYAFAHIGNFRTYVFEDLLRRSLRFFGFSVEQAMNLTDIDDKTIRGALAKKVPLKEFTHPFGVAFFEDLDRLHIERAEHYPAATDYIPQMIRIIQKLLDDGVAYRGEHGSIYFSLARFPKYGRLSHICCQDLKVNASGENDEYEKDSVSDFALWKAYDPTRDGNLFWESPFGPGRPGWHIECSAMAMDILGPTIDIHCGGVDNMFPHHENEIAQSEAFSDKLFVRHWVHVEHLLVDHKKMSKSLGNFYTLRDLLAKGYSGEEVRYLLLSTHYRTQLNFTFDGLLAARASLQRLSDLIERLKTVEGESSAGAAEREEADRGFRAALADDLNISSALAALFDWVRELNALSDAKTLGAKEAKKALEQLTAWDQVLGVLPLQKKEEQIPDDVAQFLAAREKARKEKNFSLSDQMRDAIVARGFVIEDTPKGARLKKK